MNYLNHYLPLVVIGALLLPALLEAQPAERSAEVTGKWDLTVQTSSGDFPAWLEIKRSGLNTLVGRYVGYEGSARPISKIVYSEADHSYSFSIPPQWQPRDEDLRFDFTMDDGRLSGTTRMDDETISWTGTRAPSLKREQAPNWGNPINLLDDSLSKWIIPDNNRFRMENGILVNREAGGNLITAQKFDDMKIQLEFRYPEGSNSGIYLRGRYEVQIMDPGGQPLNSVQFGGVYGFIAPGEDASKEAGEWQTMDITLVGRMVTIVLNGVEIISNRPIPGITGGALDSNEGEPGPVMLQGDHGPVEFRKIRLTPSTNNYNR
ncbi:MAG: DUF1080 domain-containing protein [Balneolales bacterium]